MMEFEWQFVYEPANQQNDIYNSLHFRCIL